MNQIHKVNQTLYQSNTIHKYIIHDINIYLTRPNKTLKKPELQQSIKISD